MFNQSNCDMVERFYTIGYTVINFKDFFRKKGECWKFQKGMKCCLWLALTFPSHNFLHAYRTWYFNKY